MEEYGCITFLLHPLHGIFLIVVLQTHVVCEGLDTFLFFRLVTYISFVFKFLYNRTSQL